VDLIKWRFLTLRLVPWTNLTGLFGYMKMGKLLNRLLPVSAAVLFVLSLQMTARTETSSSSPSPPANKPKESIVERFLRYVQIDTQSSEDSNTIPSTKKQLQLAKLLENELHGLGAADVRLDEHGILYARVPGNLPENSTTPVLGLIAHMDTSPEVSGADVHPIMHTNYQGGDIVLPKDPTQVITVAKHLLLKEMIGDDIITADGTTLLGSDDKAGCAAIMTLLDTLHQNPALPGALAGRP
jgi:di/tripeptidase